MWNVWLRLVTVLLLWIVDDVHGITAYPKPIRAKQADGKEITLRLNGDEWDNFYTDEEGLLVQQNKDKDYIYVEQGPNGVPVETSIKVGEKAPTPTGQKGRSPSGGGVPEFGGGGMSPNPIPIKEPDCAVETCGTTDFVDSRRRRLRSGPPHRRRAQVTTGQVRNLVVLIRFADHVGRTLPSPSDVDILMNQPGGDPVLADTGSVWDVFQINSYGKVDLQSTVLPWVTVSGTEAYYANGVAGRSTRTHELLREALSLVDPSVDFSSFDNDGDPDKFIDAITFLHSGYGGEFGGTDSYGAAYEDRIWSHQWELSTGAWVSAEGVQVFNYNINSALWSTSGTEIAHIGVIAHELGHFFGLPDLYDTTGGGTGVGSYDLMGNSWGFALDQKHPPLLSAWCKLQLGWATETVLSESGTYTITDSADTTQVYRIDHYFPDGEYLLIENRQRKYFDSEMPGDGLAIFHIDDLAADINAEGYPGQLNWPENGNHYQVALLQADGRYDLEQGKGFGDSGDLFRNGGSKDSIGPLESIAGPYPTTDRYQDGLARSTGNYIRSISSSGDSMTFEYEAIDVPTPAPIPVPENDLCPNAITIGSGTYTGTTIGAERTVEGTCATILTTQEVWYKIEGTGGNITVDTCSEATTFDTKLWVLQGNCQSIICVAGNDDAPNGECSVQSRATWESQVGISYFVLVHGFGTNEGDFTLNVDAAPLPTSPPTPFPSVHPTTTMPTASPTGAPTASPTIAPTTSPTPSPTKEPTATPTGRPTPSPTVRVTLPPTSTPTLSPTTTPTVGPTSSPTGQPTLFPTERPTIRITRPPTVTPTLSPTQAPTRNPTGAPTDSPTYVPTGRPSPSPTIRITLSPTAAPTKSPTQSPTGAPTDSPTNVPTGRPSPSPTVRITLPPTEVPTSSPTTSPTATPTHRPTGAPTDSPTDVPTGRPSPSPTVRITLPPTEVPTSPPTTSPTSSPTDRPTGAPTDVPTERPSPSPTVRVTLPPTEVPTSSPTTSPTTSPTQSPTGAPTDSPTDVPTGRPSPSPTVRITLPPTEAPTLSPTTDPTRSPTGAPTGSPTDAPTGSPTPSPTARVTLPPTSTPTLSPTKAPTQSPTGVPTDSPTKIPTGRPTLLPTATPTASPTGRPTMYPTAGPTSIPTRSPTVQPTPEPTARVTTLTPTGKPTSTPTEGPTNAPTVLPTVSPTRQPTISPTQSPTLSPTSAAPTKAPTSTPTGSPTQSPTMYPTETPTVAPTVTPTGSPTASPTAIPTSLSLYSGQWIEVDADAPIEERHEACMVMVGKWAILAGGRGDKSTFLYDPRSRTWSRGAKPPIELHHMQCVGAQNKLWIMAPWTGSFPEERNTEFAYVYDPLIDEWFTRTALPPSRRRGSAAAVASFDERKIYVSHGTTGGHETGDHSLSLPYLDVYDIATDSWSALSDDAPNPRDHCGAAIVNGRLCVAGGRLGSALGWPDVKETDCYDLRTGAWSVEESIPQRRSGSAYATSCDGKLLVAGGEGRGQIWTNFDVFDGTSWTALDSLHVGRHGSGLAVDCLCNQIHIASGGAAPGCCPETKSLETFFMTGRDTQCTKEADVFPTTPFPTSTPTEAPTRAPVTWAPAASAPGASPFRLIDVPTNEVIADLYDGVVIDVNALGYHSGQINIQAVFGDEVQSVFFVETQRFETGYPYSFCGNNNGDFNYCHELPLVPGPNDYTVTLIPYTEKWGQGTALPEIKAHYRVMYQWQN